MKIFYSFLVVPALFLIACGTGGIGGGSGSDDVQYAALGASDATGIGASSFSNGYVYLIEDGIVANGMSTNLMNYGVPDIEIGGIRDVELDALDLGNDLDLITILTGANDIISGGTSTHFEGDLTDIFGHLTKIDGVKIFIGNLPDLTQFPRFKESPDSDVTVERVQTFNEIIDRVASSFGATVVRLSDQPLNDSIISDDGLHPNDAGYRQIADLFLQSILPTL